MAFIFFKNFIITISSISSDGKAHVSDVLIEWKVTVPTSVNYASYISIRLVTIIKSHSKRQWTSWHENAGSFFIEIIYGKRKTFVEQYEVQTNIMLLGYFPAYTVWCHTCISKSVITLVKAKIGPLIVLETSDSVHIRETYRYIVITYFTPGITYLKHIQPFEIILYKRFFCYIPCHRESWEKPKLITYSKVFGSRITEVEINKVTIFPVIGEASWESLMTNGNTILQVATQIISTYFWILIILQYRTYMMMFVENTVIMQLCLKEFMAVATTSCTLCHLLLFIQSLEDQITFTVSETFRFPSFRRFQLVYIIRVVCVVAKTSDKLQSFGYEIEFLI